MVRISYLRVEARRCCAMLSPTAPRFFSTSIYVCSSVMRRIFTAGLNALRNASGSCYVTPIAVSKTRLPRRSRR